MDIDANIVIDRLGGTGVTAQLCELTTGRISQWRKEGIPKPWQKFLRSVRPDVFLAELCVIEKGSASPD